MRHSYFVLGLVALIACGESRDNAESEGSGGKSAGGEGGEGASAAGQAGASSGVAGESGAAGGTSTGAGGEGGDDHPAELDPIVWGEPGAPDEVIVYVVPEFVSDTYDDEAGIWIARTDGSERHRMFEGATPTLSPDGSRLAYVFDDSVWVSKSDRTERERVSEGRYACWTEDGGSLVVESGTDNWVSLELETHQLTPLSEEDVDDLCQPKSISPDGARSARIANATRLFVEDLDGSNARLLVDEGDSSGNCGIEGPFWSSDGAHVLVTQDCSDTPDWQKLAICILDADSETTEGVDYLPELIEPGDQGSWGKYEP